MGGGAPRRSRLALFGRPKTAAVRDVERRLLDLERVRAEDWK
ncbi:MAG: hypothetical protein ACRELB_07365 [Polyangiaceae bacterium]